MPGVKPGSEVVYHNPGGWDEYGLVFLTEDSWTPEMQQALFVMPPDPGHAAILVFGVNGVQSRVNTTEGTAPGQYSPVLP